MTWFASQKVSIKEAESNRSVPKLVCPLNECKSGLTQLLCTGSIQLLCVFLHYFSSVCFPNSVARVFVLAVRGFPLTRADRTPSASN